MRLAAVDGNGDARSPHGWYGRGGADTSEGVNGGVSCSGLVIGLGELECRDSRAMLTMVLSLRGATVATPLPPHAAHSGIEPLVG